MPFRIPNTGKKTLNAYIREHALHGSKEFVVRPEVMTPLGTAVNFI
jgi:hypothetical protein